MKSIEAVGARLCGVVRFVIATSACGLLRQKISVVSFCVCGFVVVVASHGEANSSPSDRSSSWSWSIQRS